MRAPIKILSVTGTEAVELGGLDREPPADSSPPSSGDPAPERRRKSTSPTKRTLAECRKRGWVAQVVERYNAHARVLVDLFGVIDLVAIKVVRDDNGTGPTGAVAIVGIQACAGASHAARRDKILAEPRAKLWVEAGGRLELWSWSQRGAAGKAKRWTLRVETYAEMLAAREGDA